MDNKDYILREEIFGYTFFDCKKLRHKFIKKADLDIFLKQNNLKKDDYFLGQLEFITN